MRRPRISLRAPPSPGDLCTVVRPAHQRRRFHLYASCGYGPRAIRRGFVRRGRGGAAPCKADLPQMQGGLYARPARIFPTCIRLEWRISLRFITAQAATRAMITGTTAGRRCTKSSKRTTPSVTWSSATKKTQDILGYLKNKNQKFLMDNALDLLREGKTDIFELYRIATAEEE